MKRMGEEIERMKAPGRRAFIPWLFALSGDTVHMLLGDMPLPWLGGLGELAFVGLYLTAVFSALDERRRYTRVPVLALSGLAVLAFALNIGYRDYWQMCFPLLSVATGMVLRHRQRLMGIALGLLGLSCGLSWFVRPDDDSVGSVVAVSWGTALGGLVAAAVLNLFEAITVLRDTREELAHAAVERERLRFSRDLHDLLGHTMSVIVVKAEAVRRLGPRNLEAALGQAADIEAVGRQALTEIREAVTGYREGSLTTELDNARSLLDASGITAEIRQSGPPLPPQTGVLLGWVVREGITNVVRHSGASRCEIEVRGKPDRVHLEITDNGTGVGSGEPSAASTGGNGLKGLAERLAAAGGSLSAAPDGRRGFRLVAELPVDDEPYAKSGGTGGDSGTNGDSHSDSDQTTGDRRGEKERAA
ncbi:two-component sensor histidine kinase [Streptomyces mobaraensis NBRC 13819 = DSM 40847]|uniref:Signal transduction histidine kinase n=1 Tax=Streptomyces mobaraensis (strain ATCC 29032 / DSM 40847 / JCM 4168 / NBRC 13819 / NCIMB 11159 / IPCR 16-22) TaxID=1223523 RepID=M3C130_STRM1|nr:histidine kinase [Streptomyces mobaraensis]EME97715.1 signal transduction histidine kinase [Streptomyces mobaraensis NBRC 13819 = DSM 40847]QTT73620.1 two-component sensor histidine kinase [Streptomyces mobaraensis NBRC 13819 = DSM 40847]